MPDSSRNVEATGNSAISALARKHSRTLLEAVGDGVFQLDTDGRFVSLDDSFLHFTHYDRDRLHGRHFSALVDEPDAQRVKRIMQLLGQTDRDTAHLHLPITTQTNDIVYCDLHLLPHRTDDTGQGAIGVIQANEQHPSHPRVCPARRHDSVSALQTDELTCQTTARCRQDHQFHPPGRGVSGNQGHQRPWRAERTDRRGMVMPQDDNKQHGGKRQEHAASLAAPPYPDSDASPASHNGASGDTRQPGNDAAAYPKKSHQPQAATRAGQQFRALADHVPGGIVAVFNTNLEFIRAAGDGFDRISAEPADMEGSRVRELWDDPTATLVESIFPAVLSGDDHAVTVPYHGRRWQLQAVPVADDHATGNTGLILMVELTESAVEQRHLQDPATLDQLATIGTTTDQSLDHRIERLLTLIRTYLDVDIGYLTAIDQDEEHVEITHTSGNTDQIRVGMDAPLEATYSYQSVCRNDLLINDSSVNDAADSDVAQRWQLESCLAETVTVDGEMHGALCVGTVAPRESPYTAAEHQFVKLAAHWLSSELERGHAKEALHQYKAFTDDVMDALDDVFYTLDEWGNLRWWNETVCNVTGYTDAEIEDMHALDFFDERFHEDISVAIQEVFETGSSRIETAVLTADGDELPYEFVASALENPDGNPVLTGIGRDIEARRAREQELERQRERLAALNSLHEVVRGVTETVVERSTREEIEQAVCDRLAASSSYRFAWIGDVDTTKDTVVPRARSGTDGYLEEIDVSIDPANKLSNGPAGQAYLTGRAQTCQHVLSDPHFEPWRDQAKAYNFRSSATIPIVHEDTVFGILNIYAERPEAFTDEERQIVEQLGEIIGHAIAAVERKRALMSDHVQEVAFRIRDVFAEYDTPATDGRIVVERVNQIGNDEYFLYGTVTTDAIETLDTLVATLPHWDSIHIRETAGSTASFEIHATDSLFIESIANYGGVTQSAIFEDDDLTLIIHLPRGNDVRDIVDIVKTEFSNVELLARRQVARSPDPAREFRLDFTEDLTDRQWTAVETAYHAGFFEWPRDATGKEIAADLGISPATFTQHLRTAERKMFDSLFDAHTPTD